MSGLIVRGEISDGTGLVFPCLKEDIDDRPLKRIEPTLKQKVMMTTSSKLSADAPLSVVRDLCDAKRP